MNGSGGGGSTRLLRAARTSSLARLGSRLCDFAISWAVLAVALLVFTASVEVEAEPRRPTVPYSVEQGGIAKPLDNRSGNAARGRAVAAGRAGNCLACHHIPIPEEQFHGDIGPDLAGVGSRLSEGKLRLRLVDPKLIDAKSIMPAFYKVEGLRQVARRFRGRPILSPQQIEDVVSYLRTLVD